MTQAAEHWREQSVVLRRAGRLAEAEAAARRALEHDPRDGVALSHLAHALRWQGRTAEALAAAREAVAAAPQAAAGWFNLGAALAASGERERGIAAYRRAVELDPRHAEAWSNLGIELGRGGDRAAEIAAYRRALQADPALAPVWSNLGNALRESGEAAEAEQACRRALALDPGFAPAWSNLGSVLRERERGAEAIAAFERALALAPGLAEAWSNLGNARAEADDYTAAIAAHRRALALAPDNAEFHYNLGVALKHGGELEAAVASYRRALELRGGASGGPGVAEWHWNLALALLTLGRLEAGWREYEWRWQTAAFEPRRYDFALWDGDAARPRRLLAWGEQGVGDEILYAGMLPDLAASALQVTLEADPRLVPLFARSFPGVTVVPRQTVPHLDPGAYDCQCPLASLGRWLRPSFAAFPRHAGYLRADAARAAHYRERLRRAATAGERIVGVSWMSRNAEFGPFKSLALAGWAGILRAPGCRFVDLQYGDTAAERAAVERDTGVRIEHLDDLDLYRDLDGLAALAAACDLVITASNVTAHVAGALGRPVWLLAPRARGKIWYWFAQREDSPWYPSMRLFRQHAAGDWSAALAQVERALREPRTKA